MLLKKMSPGRFIVLGFAVVILIGAILLTLPISANSGVEVPFIDALFTSTSAVCVTGLLVVDTKDTFNIFGRTVVALLIQIGGLGVTSVGVGFILLAGKKVGIRERTLVKEALNLNSMKGIVKLVKAILLTTLCFEGAGTLLSFLVFQKDYSPLSALGISVFHSIASFNNSGFDILGGFRNLTPYKDNILLNLTTAGLIIFGGLGFLVIMEVLHRRSFRKLSLHSKIVIMMTIILLAVGTVMLKATENITWLGAFFTSTSARTAGFSTYPIGKFTNAGLFVLVILMFIGASPGSTGGGIKTTTAYTLFKSVYSTAKNQHCDAFKRRIPSEVIANAFILTTLAMSVVCVNTLIVCILEPKYSFIQVLFEVTSAFGTVGLSTGITPDLSVLSKIIIILTMFIGRLGPVTIASMWSFKQMSSISYSEESITIG
jgi:Trk-type K+ transport systems, membrane components